MYVRFVKKNSQDHELPDLIPGMQGVELWGHH